MTMLSDEPQQGLSMPNRSAFDPLSFFNGLHREYEAVLAQGNFEAALSIAFDRFEQTSTDLSRGMPGLACGKGCDTCCTLRVLATAPEVFRIAALVKSSPADAPVFLPALSDADAATRGLGEPERVALRRPCPFLLSEGACGIYAVRPLACRGHASYSLQDCLDAAAGQTVEIAYSEPHQLVRSLVQNALQAVLREQGLAWGIYELNHAMTIALTENGAEAEWRNGNDPLVAAQVFDVSPQEMAETFDAIKATRQ